MNHYYLFNCGNCRKSNIDTQYSELTWSEPTMSLNFGPQHPAAHGVLRLLLRLQGERCISADPHIGLLHRGTEKLIEQRTYMQALPYFDRLDYVSCVTQEHAFCLAIESLLNISVSKISSISRVLFSEIARILNHLMCITTHAMDVGALTPFLWLFEERELLFEIFEQLTGARMHSAYMRPGGVYYNIPNTLLLTNLNKLIIRMYNRIDELEDFLNKSRIWRQRTYNIGYFDKQQLLSWSTSGVISRASGLDLDLRREFPYDCYDSLKFRVPVSYSGEGDSYTRYLIRVEEIRQSLYIVEQCIANLLSTWHTTQVNPHTKVCSLLSSESKPVLQIPDMEFLINHFKDYSNKNKFIPTGSTYVAVESPKGEFGVFIIGDSTEKPFRCKVRSPGYYSLQALTGVAETMLLADVVAFIGSIDVVFGEIDR